MGELPDVSNLKRLLGRSDLSEIWRIRLANLQLKVFSICLKIHLDLIANQLSLETKRQEVWDWEEEALTSRLLAKDISVDAATAAHSS